MHKFDKYGNFKSLGKQKDKRQIILCHTSREVEPFLTSLTFRCNGKYQRIPNYLIKRNGEILQLLDDKSYSMMTYDLSVNKHAIFIMLENLGWLEKKPLSDHYLNWIGNIYKQGVFEKKWRDYYLWQPYTNEQIDKTIELCKVVAEENKIDLKFIGHNTKIDGVEYYDGILCRSNFDSIYTDLSPAFDFEYMLKKIENEQYSSK